MISKDDLRFNCAESIIIRVNEGRPLLGLGPAVMRIASGFGGGVGGWGSVCGAVSGAVMALGLIHGTEGTETVDEFSRKRDHQREMSQRFLAAFEEEFGTVNCMDLLGVDRRTEEGKIKYDEMKARGETHCGEYVEWASSQMLKILK